MAKCASCGSTVVIGGKKQGDLRFCSDKCLQQGLLLPALAQIPPDLLEKQVHSVHQGDCPKCGGSGPIDVHTSHTIWSILVMTSWNSTPQISCRKCGIKAKVKHGIFSLLAGWWGFPWGIIGTPIQVIRNFVGIFTAPDPAVPSEALQAMVGLDVAARLVEVQAQGAGQQQETATLTEQGLSTR